MADQHPLLLRAEQIAAKLNSFSHPWNPNSELTGAQLGKTVGLQRTGVNFIRVPPGKESFIYHSHHREEEWIYILSGHGVAEIDEAEFEVNPGDFMGFPTPSVAHHLKNTGDEDLVYLAGGENLDIEIAEFPRLKKRMIRREEAIDIYDFSDSKPFEPLET
ncbi:cupin domain-containing protein [Pseudanabaena sp. FACHB-2040]|uniref:cupin domain-containing protein n=1 Tax=Pseudanabaena sp. FACHB-2040 TaxID=2692859 RepID=UPI0016833FBB|nr:cupin domain-containing protein [Pseudanabaena sp. FACHB-2040]MBD2261262.1 cupin domain-containing protein [Pseudanabaena sp. FACHB-2040]